VAQCFSARLVSEAQRLVNVSSILSRAKSAPLCYSGVLAMDRELVKARLRVASVLSQARRYSSLYASGWIAPDVSVTTSVKV
jgi:hypothetical protein